MYFNYLRTLKKNEKIKEKRAYFQLTKIYLVYWCTQEYDLRYMKCSQNVYIIINFQNILNLCWAIYRPMKLSIYISLF